MQNKNIFLQKEKRLKYILIIITLILIFIWGSIYYLQQKNYKNLLKEERTHSIFNLKMIQNNVRDDIYSKNVMKSLLIEHNKTLIQLAINTKDAKLIDSLRKQLQIGQFFIIDRTGELITSLPSDTKLEISFDSLPTSKEYRILSPNKEYLYLSKFYNNRWYIAGMDSKIIKDLLNPVQLSTLFQNISDQILSIYEEKSNLYHIHYIVIQDKQGVIAATANLKKIASISSDKFLENIISSNQPDSRISKYKDKKIFETVIPSELFKNSIIRFGVSFMRIKKFRDKQNIMLAIYSAFFIFLFISEYLFYKYYKNVNQTRKELEMKRHMAEIGKLGGEVAHEIKNPLNAIYMSLQQLKIDYGAKNIDDLNESLELIYDEIDRLNQIVQKFLYFSRPKELNYTNNNVGKFLKRIKTLFSEQCNKMDFKCKLISDKTITWEFDRDAMQTVITNLLKNAIESFENVSLKHQKIDKKITIDYKIKKKNLYIIIKDNGEGIDPEIKENIWNFYFTTKDSGSGIGLPTVKKIIEEHYGKISIMSSPHLGTTVEIILPSRSNL